MSAGDGLLLVATLRDGSDHTIIVDQGVGAARLFDEISAGRSQALRGWVDVKPSTGAIRAVVSGDEIVRLRVVERPA